jgi:hypothetical protein
VALFQLFQMFQFLNLTYGTWDFKIL